MNLGTPKYMIAHRMVVVVMKRNSTTVVMINCFFFPLEVLDQDGNMGVILIPTTIYIQSQYHTLRMIKQELGMAQ